MRNKLILLVQLTWLVDTSSNKTETATNLVARRKTFEDNKNSTSINLGKNGKKKKIKAARKMVAGKPQKNVNSTTENVGKKKTKKAARKMIAAEKIKQKNSTSSVCPRRGSGHWRKSMARALSFSIIYLFVSLHFSKEVRFFWIETKNYTDLSSGDIEKRNTQKSVGVATRFSWNEI